MGLFVVARPLHFDSFDNRPLCQVEQQRQVDKKAIPGDPLTLTHLTGKYMFSHTNTSCTHTFNLPASPLIEIPTLLQEMKVKG